MSTLRELILAGIDFRDFRLFLLNLRKLSVNKNLVKLIFSCQMPIIFYDRMKYKIKF